MVPNTKASPRNTANPQTHPLVRLMSLIGGDWRLGHGPYKSTPTGKEVWCPVEDKLFASAESVVPIIRKLSALNARRHSIFVAPASFGVAVYIDDLLPGSLGELVYTHRICPTAVVETSPASYQAWLPVPKGLSDYDVSAAFTSLLSGDHGAHAPKATSQYPRFGRAPGFTNTKKKHLGTDGRYPYARLLLESHPVVMAALPYRPTTEDTIRKIVTADQPDLSSSNHYPPAARAPRPSEGTFGGGAAPAGRKLLEDNSPSGRDMRLAISAAFSHADFESVQRFVGERSADLLARKGAHASSYLETTAIAAIAYYRAVGGDSADRIVAYLRSACSSATSAADPNWTTRLRHAAMAAIHAARERSLA